MQILRLDAENFKPISWLFPAAIIMAVLIGINTVGFLFLYNRFTDLDTYATLMYNHAVHADAEIEMLTGNKQPPVPRKP